MTSYDTEYVHDWIYGTYSGRVVQYHVPHDIYDQTPESHSND